MQKVKWIEIPEESKNEWIELCPPNHYRYVRPDDLPLPIPDDLKRKCNNAVLIASGEVGGSVVYYMANLNRYDTNSCAIDQEPFGFAIISGEVQASGCFIHHGNWEGRTTVLSGELLTNIQNQIGRICPIHDIPEESFGQLHELDKSNINFRAFEEIVKKLRG